MVFIDLIAIILSVASTAVAGFSVYYNSVMHKVDLTHENYEDIKNWYEKTLHIMKELYVEHAENFSKDNKKDLFKDLVNLSQQIDSGRLYFPNISTGDNLNKPEVFRGKRPLIMDFLVLYYDIFNTNRQCEKGNLEILRSLQRAFTSELVTYLKDNKTSKTCDPYTKYAKNDFINIKNLNNENFRKILVTEDIVKEIDNINKSNITFNVENKTKNKTETKEEKKINTLKEFFNTKEEEKQKLKEEKKKIKEEKKKKKEEKHNKTENKTKTKENNEKEL